MVQRYKWYNSLLFTKCMGTPTLKKLLLEILPEIITASVPQDNVLKLCIPLKRELLLI